jgi:hypothetical protein
MVGSKTNKSTLYISRSNINIDIFLVFYNNIDNRLIRKKKKGRKEKKMKIESRQVHPYH